MTRKHFEIFAEEIRNIMDPHARLNAAIAAATACKRINAKFDFDRFYKACGVV
jgi:hypothetical protein